jgi:hypothetical protein
VKAHNALAVLAVLVIIGMMAVLYHVFNDDVFTGVPVPNARTEEVVLTLQGMDPAFRDTSGDSLLRLEDTICKAYGRGLTTEQIIRVGQDGGLTIFQATDAVAVAQEQVCPPSTP